MGVNLFQYKTVCPFPCFMVESLLDYFFLTLAEVEWFSV